MKREKFARHSIDVCTMTIIIICRSGLNWKELYKVSWNWTHGYCKDRNLLKFKFK